jgi:hypothetical protein
MRVALALLAALLPALGSCSGAPSCAADADCPSQHHCVLADGGLRGRCQQECQATADCGDPARRCDSLGRCVAWGFPQSDAATPDDAAGAGDAGPDDAAGAGDAGPDDATPVDATPVD